jgi:DNA repair protein RadC
LQRSFCGGDCRARVRERAAGYARALGCFQSLFRLVERRCYLTEAALGRTAEHRLLAGRFFRRSLGAVAAVERVVQRQSIIALAHGVVRILQRLDGGLVLIGRVAIGTCGACRVDRTLGLIHFAGWRCGARNEQQTRAEERGEGRERTTTQHRFEYSVAMKSLSVHDRPREKLLRLGAAGLGDNELVAVVVGSGSRRVNALALANDILETSGGLHGVPRTSVDELRKLDGMGAAKAAQVLAAVELGRRTLLRCPPARLQFVNPRDAAAYLLPQFGARPVEQFGLMMLDTKHRLIRTSVVSVGTLDSSPAHPREIFREAASACAAAIVLFHNHPSGDPMPSRDDVELTRRLVQAGEIMGIDVIDHVILADTRYFSFREAGRL